MQQVLFTIPIFKSQFGGDGIPVYGFGAMLFLTFVLVTWWGSVRAKRVGLKPEKFQDMTIWIFVTGLVGARLLYMIQYSRDFPDVGGWGMVLAFFQIWNGGIIFYGSALGGTIGYGLFYWFVLRKLNVSGWQLADAVAPLLALGLAIGRLGCYLNGCCWGQVACEETCHVPLGAAHFPLLPAHARGVLVDQEQRQTSTGFILAERDDDPRSRVAAVERGSPADAAGVRPGDRIVKVNGRSNQFVLAVVGPADKVAAAVAALRKDGTTVDDPVPAGRKSDDSRASAYFDDLKALTERRRQLALEGPLLFTPTDRLRELVSNWPRGQASLEIGVERDGKAIDLPAFSPRTVGLYPTQLYETLSMVLLIFVLLAYYRYRRHDGQLMVVLMLGYSVHRFINESLRVEPSVGGGLTLSQWGSVVIFAAAVGIEIYLWRAMPSRWTTTPPPVQPPPATNT